MAKVQYLHINTTTSTPPALSLSLTMMTTTTMRAATNCAWSCHPLPPLLSRCHCTVHRCCPRCRFCRHCRRAFRHHCVAIAPSLVVAVALSKVVVTVGLCAVHHCSVMPSIAAITLPSRHPSPSPCPLPSPPLPSCHHRAVVVITAVAVVTVTLLSR